MHYYILRHSQKVGPLLQHQIISEIQDKNLSLDDLAWRQGDSEWMPLAKMEEIAEHALLKNRDEEAQTVEAPEEEDLFQKRASQANRTHSAKPLIDEPFAPPAPLPIRIIARLIDQILILFGAAYLLVQIYGEQTVLEYQNWQPDQLITINLWLRAFMIAYEIFFLKIFGATPGKFLFRLRVIDEQGQFPTWKTASIRTFDAFVRGAGLYFIYFTPFTFLLSVSFTAQNKIAPWDVRTRLQVVRKP